MSWNDWEVVWRRQDLTVGANTDLQTLIDTFEAKRRRVAVSVTVRNVAEGGTGIVVLPVLIYLAWRHWPTGWPLVLCAAIYLAITCVFVADQIRVWRKPSMAGASLLTQVAAEIAELKHQRRLGRWWWAWYLVPGVIGIILGGWGLEMSKRTGFSHLLLVELLTTPLTLAYIFLMIAVPTWALIVTLQHVKKACTQIDLRISELEKLRRFLAGE